MARDFTILIADPAKPLGGTIQATIPGDLYLRHYKFNEVKYWNLLPAREVLTSPLLIFEGVRKFQEGGWCYAGRPKEHYLRPGATAPLQPRHIFCVYLNPLMRVYEWRLEAAEKEQSPFPQGHLNRYKRLAWQHTSLAAK